MDPSEPDASTQPETDPQFQTPNGRELLKSTVTAWVIIKNSNPTLDNGFVSQRPLIADDESTRSTNYPSLAVETGSIRDIMGSNSVSLEDHEEVIDVVPAQTGTRVVWGPGETRNGEWDTFVQIGIEYPDATQPDWDRVIDSMLEGQSDEN